MNIAPLPAEFAWIDKEPGPRILLEMRKVFGTKEAPGPRDNPTIVQWAESEGYQNYHDVTPWCGIGMGYVVKQAGWEIPSNPAWAANWLKWGNTVSRGSEMLGDVLVFHRSGGNHVSMYVAENLTHFFIMGANQADQVNIEPKEKSLLLGARRCPWRINQPANVGKRFISSTGALASNDA